VRSTLLLSTASAITLATVACGPAIRVRTSLEPDANLANLHTFHVLSAPTRHDGKTQSSSDPMLDNSITNRALRQDLAKGFEHLGYVPTQGSADFDVAYYASTREKLDITTWDYGHAAWPGWYWWRWGGPQPVAEVQPYTQGTVVVDVVDPTSKQLLWRGEGVAAVSDDPSDYAKNLEQMVTAILQKFPRAQV
jgi:hypothetical protein